MRGIGYSVGAIKRVYLVTNSTHPGVVIGLMDGSGYRAAFLIGVKSIAREAPF